MAELQEILTKIEQSGAQKVKVAVVDIDGILRGKYVSKEKFISATKNGFGFCNVVFGWDCVDSCYDNSRYSGWHTGYPDAQVKIDLSTYRTIPWENKIPFFLGDFFTDNGQPLTVSPRQVLKTVIEKANRMGFYPDFGLEFEWFNFRETPQSLREKQFSHIEPLTPGMFGYSVLRASQNENYFSDLMDQLKEFRIPLEGLHTETGPGVFEAAITHSEALEAADRAVLFKAGVKEIAHRNQVIPSFMAKWNAKLPGCSGHLHQSLWDKKNNLFFNDENDLKMSDLCKNYLAGQLKCLPEILPFFAPNVNSYKRLVEGLWAPTRVTWGVDNRTTAIRVISASSSSMRIETRVTGADINPYIAVAAALASGLYGIEHQLKLEDPPVKGNAYENKTAINLAKNLQEATEILTQSKIAKEIFGPEFVDHFVRTRQWEWRQFQNAITNWELERYFEII